MARGITENDVWTASDALLLEGARPTIERVRQKIGRGSPNTVSPYLDTWFKNLGGRIKDPGAFSAPPDLPDPVQQAAKHFWDMALAETRRDFDQRLREGMAAAVSNVEAGKERAKLAEAAAFEAISKVTHLHAELAVRTGQLEQERLARVQAQAQAQERSSAAEQRALVALDAERQGRARAEKRADAMERKLDAAEAGARAVAARQAADLATRQDERERLAVELATAVGERNRLQAEVRILESLVGAEQRLAQEARTAGAATRHLLAQFQPAIAQESGGTLTAEPPSPKPARKPRRAVGAGKSK